MKRTRLTIWLLSGLCSITAASCSCKEKSDPEPEQTTVKVSYAQTYCSDRWGQAQGTQQLAAVATAYLAQQGITLYQPRASAKYPAAVCNACSCTTGLVLEGTVSPADLAAVQALGFQ
ncbi:hypothetical protein [Hymenobacter negativus]|uniref:Uncharacterized protein n=1 Tax=Hymenobacter negativus TaxID=2795026 RepID=A0ABS3Q9J7_9BACT|nr:hypothetical protein [Hymenobacter negativus]MBO2007918.1 hypothetical protein [Hymenobacter negativus]